MCLNYLKWMDGGAYHYDHYYYNFFFFVLLIVVFFFFCFLPPPHLFVLCDISLSRFWLWILIMGEMAPWCTASAQKTLSTPLTAVLGRSVPVE